MPDLKLHDVVEERSIQKAPLFLDADYQTINYNDLAVKMVDKLLAGMHR